MTKWEYKTVIVQVTKKNLDIDLSNLGRDGWELVSAAPKTFGMNFPEMTIKPAIGSQKISAQQNAIMGIVEIIYFFKREVV